MQSKQYRNGYTYISWNIFIISGKVSLGPMLERCRKTYLLLACGWVSWIQLTLYRSCCCLFFLCSLLSDFIYIFNVRLLENKKKRWDYCLDIPAEKRRIERSLSSFAAAEQLTWKNYSKVSGELSRRTEEKSLKSPFCVTHFARFDFVGDFFFRLSFSFILLQMGGHLPTIRLATCNLRLIEVTESGAIYQHATNSWFW